MNKKIIIVCFMLVLMLCFVGCESKSTSGGINVDNSDIKSEAAVDYVNSYYKYLSKNYMNIDYKWMHSELFNLDNNKIPKLVVAYGEQYYKDYNDCISNNDLIEKDMKELEFAPDKEVASFSVFSQNEDGTITEKKLRFKDGSINDVCMTFPSLKASILFIGSEKVKIYFSDYKGKDCFIYEYYNGDKWYSETTTYICVINGNLELIPTTILKRIDKDSLASTYMINEKNVIENEYQQELNKLIIKDSGFTYVESAGRGDGLYESHGKNYKFANNLKKEFKESYLENEYTDKLNVINEALKSKNSDEALKMCNEILSLDFNNKEALKYKAKVLKNRGEYDKAIQLLNRVIVLYDDNESKNLISDIDRQKKLEIVKNFLNTGEINKDIKLGEFTYSDMVKLIGNPEKTEYDIDYGYPSYCYRDYIFNMFSKETGDKEIYGVSVCEFAGIKINSRLGRGISDSGTLSGSTRDDVKNILGELYNEKFREKNYGYRVAPSWTILMGNKARLYIAYDEEGKVYDIELISIDVENKYMNN